ncbi:inositol monophosphatase 1 isoform X2 [Lepeophtheirus salmonis]
MNEYEYTDKDLKEFLDVGVKLVKEAGSIMKSANRSPKNVTLKTDSKDYASQVLTETDQKVEKHLIAGLSKVFPDHEFIGEESVSEGGDITKFSNNPTWIIDPIDGTMNFIHNNPLVCTSMGLAINRKIVLGVVNCPMIDQLFTAITGKGAFLNGEKLSVSDCRSLEKAMVICEVSCGENEAKKEANIGTMKNLLNNVQAIRCPGPAALDMCWIGAGYADSFFHFGIHCWDMAAGAIIIKEAGGVIMDPDGNDFDFMAKRCLCASSRELAEEMRKLIVSYKVDRDFPEVCKF